MGNTMIILLTVAYFIVASITTFDIRMTQARRDGTLPPAWIAVFAWLQ